MVGTLSIGSARPYTVPRIGVVSCRPATGTQRPRHDLSVSNGYTTVCMRHRVKKDRLGRPADQRKALLRSLTTAVLEHGSIKTTSPKAKAARKYVERMITLAKRGDDHARNQAKGWVYDADLVDRMFEQAPDRFADRNGGYCRVVKELQRRRGDNAEMAVLQFVDYEAPGGTDDEGEEGEGDDEGDDAAKKK